MKTIEDEVNELHTFVVESLDRIKIDKWGDSFTVSIGSGDKELNFDVDKTDEFPCFARYNISRIRGAQTSGRYEKYSKTIKKIYQILEKEHAIREAKEDSTFWRDYIQKILDYDERDEEDDFGEPMHTEFLPDCPLEVGKTYLVPLKLIAKERRFDGGRGTEYYKFNYRTEDYGYRHFSIIDYHMTKDIQPMVDGDVIAEALSNPTPISEELKEKVTESASRTTFC
jgi:hypothetical protein